MNEISSETHQLFQRERICEDCKHRRMIKIEDVRQKFSLTFKDLETGIGGAEECWECGRVYCEGCYPERPPNTCVCRQGRDKVRNIDGIVFRGALRLVKVRYLNSSRAVVGEQAAVTVIRSVFQELAQLSKSEDVQRRVQFCEQALHSIRLAEHPEAWARLQLELATGLYQDTGNARADNLERALNACQSALAVYTRQKYPGLWAVVQHLIGNIYQDRIRGNRAENVEHAIDAYKFALLVFTRETHSERWAETHYNLGNAYWKRILGDHAENLECALGSLRTALTVRTHNASPINWAMTQNSLGNVYRARIKGMRAENLEQGVEAFNAALTVFTPDTHPDRWAMTQNNLGIAYTNRIYGDRAENLECAIEAYQAALSVYDRYTFSEQWAMAKHNLGNAFCFRIRGDRAENMELAIEAYKECLSVHTREGFPADWAMTQNSLGIAYRDRILGDCEENLERAIQAYESALIVYTRDAFPRDWAMAQNNLGTGYRKRVRGDRSENVERAIEAYKAAITVYTRDACPEDWAGVQINLGIAYLDRIRDERAENLERAIEAFKAALTVYTRETYPEQWADTQNNLGSTYNERIYGEPSENVMLAIQAYQAALEVDSPERLPQRARGTAGNLARLRFEQQNWNEAYFAMLIAIEAAERLYGGSLTEASKAAEIKENARLYQQMVDICLRLSPPRPLEAFLYAEEGRSRLMRDQLGLSRSTPPNNIPPAVIEHEAQLLQDVRSLENWIRDAPDEAVRRRWVDEAVAIRTELDSLWNTLICDYGASDYVARRRGTKLKWEDLQDWLSAQSRRIVLLEFFTLADRLVAFIARAGESEPSIVVLDISPHRQVQFVFRFHREVQFRFDYPHRLAETWRTLGSLLLPELLPHLEDADLVYIIPHLILHGLPLHALEYEGKLLIEYFPIAYAPSAAAVMRLTRRSPILSTDYAGSENGGERMLVVGNPTGDLSGAMEEAEAVANRCSARLLPGRDANKNRVLSELARATRAHFATHGFFRPGNPLDSGIHLADLDTLTARDILAQPFNLQLLVLNACQTALQTGAQDTMLGDERAGLAHACLSAGVSSLVLNMWDVQDSVAKEFMLQFYNHLYDRNGIQRSATVDAWRAAMIETRKRTRHTFFWAPFMLYGDWR